MCFFWGSLGKKKIKKVVGLCELVEAWLGGRKLFEVTTMSIKIYFYTLILYDIFGVGNPEISWCLALFLVVFCWNFLILCIDLGLLLL